MKPFWKHPTDDSARYRFHVLERNYTVMAKEDPFGDVEIMEITSEWRGGKSRLQKLLPGEEFDRVSMLFLAAKKDSPG